MNVSRRGHIGLRRYNPSIGPLTHPAGIGDLNPLNRIGVDSQIPLINLHQGEFGQVRQNYL